MKKLFWYLPLGFALALVSATGAFATPEPCASSNPTCSPHTAPEIDPILAISGIAMFASTVAIVRARRRR
jgi:hypothetical protein